MTFHPALSNREVLDHIFSFIPSTFADLKELKNCRLVSKFWCDVATDTIGRMTFIHTINTKDTEECPICRDEVLNERWKMLACSHKLCIDCHKQIEKVGVTMSRVTLTSIKCPFCGGNAGKEVGTCPNGTMKVHETKIPCKGYERFTTWVINYSVPDRKYYLNRTAYIPNTAEGRRLLALLKIAWDRRLTFSIGTSITTGVENTLVWNIHHKTAMDDSYSHGYPDPEYLNRLMWELKAFGIE